MVRRNLSEELKEAGHQLLEATDALEMSAQGAMWVYNHVLEDWRYLLFTSLVDSIGRKKTYQLLIRAFVVGEFPKSLTVEDVHLGGLEDELFLNVASTFGLPGHNAIEFKDCIVNGLEFDAFVYRSTREKLTPVNAKNIVKSFSRTVLEKEVAN